MFNPIKINLKQFLEKKKTVSNPSFSSTSDRTAPTYTYVIAIRPIIYPLSKHDYSYEPYKYRISPLKWQGIDLNSQHMRERFKWRVHTSFWLPACSVTCVRLPIGIKGSHTKTCITCLSPYLCVRQNKPTHYKKTIICLALARPQCTYTHTHTVHTHVTLMHKLRSI